MAEQRRYHRLYTCGFVGVRFLCNTIRGMSCRLQPYVVSCCGSQGQQGPAGQIGPQGVRGVIGIQGFQGPQGNQGQGNQGFQGNQGNQGFQGNQGLGVAIAEDIYDISETGTLDVSAGGDGLYSISIINRTDPSYSIFATININSNLMRVGYEYYIANVTNDLILTFRYQYGDPAQNIFHLENNTPSSFVLGISIIKIG